MKRNKYLFVCFMLLAIVLAGGIFTGLYVNLNGQVHKKHEIRVVTSFYPVYIAALNVADSSPHVVLENLSEPQTGCMHDYQLTPQDMILLSRADLFLVNGGGIENFLAKVGQSYPNSLYRKPQKSWAFRRKKMPMSGWIRDFMRGWYKILQRHLRRQIRNMQNYIRRMPTIIVGKFEN